MDKKNITLQDYLKQLRTRHGFSQEYVAEQLHIIRQTYSHYETGRINPPVNSLYNLAKLYGVPAEDLMQLAATYHIEDEDESGTVRYDTEFTIPPDDTDEYNVYLESHNLKLNKLRQDERLCLYYYNYMDSRRKKDILSFMKVIKQNDREEKIN